MKKSFIVSAFFINIVHMPTTSSPTSASNVIIVLGIPVFIIPLVLFNSTIDPALTPRFLTLSIILFLVAVFGHKAFQAAAANGQMSFLGRSIVLPLSAYFLCMVFSLSKAVNVSEGIFEVLKTLMFLLFVAIAALVIRTQRGSIDVIARSIVILSAVVSIVGISQYYNLGFQWVPGPANAQPAATFANKNLFSSFLFLTIPFIVYAFFNFNGKWHYTAGTSTALVLFAILVAQTRAVWVALFVSSIFVIVTAGLLLLKRKLRLTKEELGHHGRRLLRLAALTLVLVSIAIFQSVLFKPSVVSQTTTLDKAASILDPQNSTRVERLMLWEKTICMIKDYPLFGVGAGNWKIILPKYGLGGTRMETGLTHFLQPHNDFLWVAAETGIPGFVAYVMVFLIALFYCAKIIMTSNSLRDQILALAMSFGVFGYGIISFFDFPKERIEHLIYFGLILSTIVAGYDSLFPAQRKFRRRAVSVINGIIVAVLAFSIFVGYTRVNAEIHTRYALAAKGILDWDGVIREVDEAYSGLATMDPMVTPLPWYRGVAYFSKNDTRRALKDFELAYSIHPYHIHVLNNLGTCNELQGEHDKAIDMYSRAITISPHFEEARLNLTAVYFNSGKYHEAYETIKECIGSKNPRMIETLNAVKEKLNLR